MRLITLQIRPFSALQILGLTLSFGFALAPQAKASFIGDYAPSQFNLTNVNADGSVSAAAGGLSIVLTGGNNGSGLPGTTDYLASAAGAGKVSFQFSYSSLDFPGLDFAGFLVGGAFSQFANTDGQSGTAMFTVSTGQRFGFRVGTADNTGEPGILKISSFTAPSGAGSAVPEPGTASFFLISAGAALAFRPRGQGSRA